MRKLEQRVRDYVAGREPTPDVSYHEQLATHISDTIGHPVQVRPDKTNSSEGKIAITYLGLDAFDSVMERMNVKIEDENLSHVKDFGISPWVIERTERSGCNPQTGESMEIAAAK